MVAAAHAKPNANRNIFKIYQRKEQIKEKLKLFKLRVAMKLEQKLRCPKA